MTNLSIHINISLMKNFTYNNDLCTMHSIVFCNFWKNNCHLDPLKNFDVLLLFLDLQFKNRS